MEVGKEGLGLCGTPGLTQSSLASVGTSPLSSLSLGIWFARRGLTDLTEKQVHSKANLFLLNHPYDKKE